MSRSEQGMVKQVGEEMDIYCVCDMANVVTISVLLYTHVT